MSDLLHEALTEQIIGAAMEVHRALGPGLLESAYEECLALACADRGLEFVRQIELPIVFMGHRIAPAYRMDFVFSNSVVVEVKAVEKIIPIHEAQLLTYLKLSGYRVGLLINFCVPLLKDGIHRRIL